MTTLAERAEAETAKDLTVVECAVGDAELERLASLPPIAYDREREAVAERLGIRVGTLDKEVGARRGKPDAGAQGRDVTFDEPEPWGEPVELSDLLDAISATLKRYVRMRGAATVACSLWVAQTWVHDAALVSAILAITSPEKRCGKTTLLEVLGKLVRRALATSNVTAAALFRAVEKFSPSLLIDEADTFLKASDELRGILNSGHRRDSAYVIRCVGDEQEPRQFRTWSPKVIALIGKLPDTLSDRSIEIALRRRGPGEKVERWRGKVDGDLTRKLARFAKDSAENLRAAQPQLPSALHDRAADSWELMLAIADLAGGTWPTRARDAAKALSSDEAASAGTSLLEDIRRYFAEHATDKVHSNPLADWLKTLEDRPWPEWGHAQKPITARQIAKLLEPFGIKPRQVRIGPDNLQGYLAAAFDEAFARYLPGGNPTILQPNGDAASNGFPNPTRKNGVGDENPLERSCDAVCRVVGDGNGGQARGGPSEGVEVLDL
ncbi:MAG: DUF3631 domain-containing protein [Rhodanobacteraceae bacterium]